MKQSLALSAILLGAGSQARSIFARDGDCKDVHVFIAKGNNEPYPGRQSKLVNAICQGIDSCDYEDIIYENPGGSDYCKSVSEGTANAVSQINAYNSKCPKAKLVVSGFSQGGDVASGVFGGNGGQVFGCTITTTAGVDANSAAGKAIAAGLFFGDVRHTANQPYNYLSGANKNGASPRSSAQLAKLSAYSDRLRSYCPAADPVCAGGDNVDDHLNYFDLYSTSAADWVHELLKKASSGESAQNSGSSGSGSGSGSGSSGHATVSVPASLNGTATATGGNGQITDAPSFTVSTVYATQVHTITSCPPTVKNCPVGHVTTQTVAVTTTTCPVGQDGNIVTQPPAKATVPAYGDRKETKTYTTKDTTVQCLICETISRYSATAAPSVTASVTGGHGWGNGTVPTGKPIVPGGGSGSGSGSGPSQPVAVPTGPKTTPTAGVPSASAGSLVQVSGLLMAVLAVLAF